MKIMEVLLCPLVKLQSGWPYLGCPDGSKTSNPLAAAQWRRSASFVKRVRETAEPVRVKVLPLLTRVPSYANVISSY